MSHTIIAMWGVCLKPLNSSNLSGMCISPFYPSFSKNSCIRRGFSAIIPGYSMKENICKRVSLWVLRRLCIFVNTWGKIGFSLVPFPSNQSLIILQHMFLFQPHWSIHCLYMYIANNILYPLSFAALPYPCPVYTAYLSLQGQTQVPTPVGNCSHLPKD